MIFTKFDILFRYLQTLILHFDIYKIRYFILIFTKGRAPLGGEEKEEKEND